ncbi:MAG: molybdopterin-dependent oxidoreductase [Deltaproteobacteria bacterium]|nr:molybdopterin-dependent oxidoreductase [Deltaproteobacteria bacterium]
MEEKHTICRLCSALCPIVVHLEKGRIISAERETDFPVEKGYFCPKLRAAADIVYSTDRVKTPLIKEEKEGKAIWKEVSWKQALDTIAEKLDFFKTTYGAESVCWMRGMAADWGAPWDYAIRFMNAFGSPNIIGNGAVCHVAREMAHYFTYGVMSYPDYRNSKCIVVWGKNDRDCNPQGYESILYAKERGAKLIVVDPIETTFASLADIWLQIRPGCDGLLAMSMIHVIISESLYDGDFVKTWMVGFDDLKEAAKAYAPERVAQEMWLDAAKIRESARLYARTKPACIADGNGLDMHVNVFQNTRSVCMLRALTGSLDKKGGDLLPKAFPTEDIQLKERFRNEIKPISFEYPLFNKFHRTRGDHVLSSIVDAILEENPYPIKALIIQASNPVVTMANSKRFLRALEKLEFIVVIDLFITRTAKHAHIILPTTTCFEKTQLNLSNMSRNHVTLQDQVIDWVENTWPDWKITFELAKRMGYKKEFPWDTVEEAIAYQLRPSGITVESLRKNHGGIDYEETRYEKYRNSGFPTQSGKVELYSETLREHSYPPIPTFAEDEKNNLSFYNQKDDFPLMGISGARPNSFVHSQFRNIPSLLKREAEPVVDIHSIDAETRDIMDGDNVRVETPNGRITMKAKVSTVVHPGSVRIAWGWGECNPDFNINDLTDDEMRDPITSTPSNRCFMCNVIKGVKTG